MPQPIKITADVTQVTKSIIDLGRELQKVGKDKNPVSIFDARERKFIQEELNKALEDLKTHFSDGKKEISRLLDHQKQLTKNSTEELKVRKQITEAIKEQSKLSRQIEETETALVGDGVRGKGSMLGGLGGLLKKIGLAVGARALFLGARANAQFVESTGDRIRAQGLGMTEPDLNRGTSAELARVGLTRRELIQSRIQATALGSRQAGGQQATLQRAGFERAFGLERGQMTDILARLRPTVGGDRANQMQMKLQASVIASGIEDAVGPYLESITNLLSSINETGLTATDQLIQAFAELSAAGSRTPEQIAATIGGVDQAVRGSAGERNAMLQLAFASRGIGGETIGGTRFAIESGGILGLNRSEFEERGFSPEMLGSMGEMGLFGGVGEGGGLSARAGGILDLLREMGGMEEGQSFGDLQDPTQIASLGGLTNALFGTEGAQGLSTAKLFEDIERGVGGGEDGLRPMTREEFDKRFREIQEGGTSVDSGRLDAINESLSGTTKILRDIHESNLDILGRTMAPAINELVELEIKAIDLLSNIAENTGGLIADTKKDIQETVSALTDENAPLPESAQNDSPLVMDTLVDAALKLSGPNFQMPENITRSKRNRANQTPNIADDVEKGTLRALERRDNRRKRSDTMKNSPSITNQIILPDGGIQNSTLQR